MDRDIQADEREPEVPRAAVREHGRTSQQSPRERDESERTKNDTGRPNREIDLSYSKRQAMAEIGRFRTLSLEDLKSHRYSGDATRMQQEVGQLSSQKLVQTRSVWPGKNKGKLQVITLTKRGIELLKRSGETGMFYAGFVKPAEMAHDAAIYRMYQAENARIAKQGGQIRQITLDYELKRKVYSTLAKEKPGSPEYKKRQEEVAAEHGLKVIRGHIQLPDLRIDYQTKDGELSSTDLELATLHYRAGQLASKADAGFRFYAFAEDQNRLSSVFDDHHITTEILWL